MVSAAENKREMIIIVDDNITNLYAARNSFRGIYNVLTAPSGNKLFQLLEKVTPNLILLDILMPDMDGYEVAKTLKSNERTANIPIIFLSAKIDPEDEVMGLNLGAVDYITKPFSKELLVKRVGLHLLLEKQKRDLQETSEKAEAASREKSSFLANMSHEMRTPLNAILGLSELSLEAGGLNADDYTNLEKIRGAGLTLLNIVSDILDISKIETGKFELIPVEYETADMIADAVTQSILHIGEKPIRFILNVDESFPAKLYGDELRAKQILNNLLSNAFKYTLLGEVELTVGCTFVNDTAFLTASVRDTGIGIRQEDIASLFDDYIQMDMSANRKIMGTGLGLPIARRLAESMGGEITVTSEYGKGSVFTASIKHKYVNGDTIGPEMAESLRSSNYSGHKRRHFANITPVSMPYARVLLVDDVVTNLDVAKGLLKRYNMQIDCLTNGQDAIEAVRNEHVRYNAVFMDHMMPGMDGVEATRLIREIGTDYAKSVPIIAFTANALVGNEEMFLNNGFQAFISKPIEIARLDAIVREWVRDKEKEKSFNQTGGDGAAIPAKKNAADLSRLPDISGLDIEKGIERFGGDEAAYISVLRSYTRNTPSLLKTSRIVSLDKLSDYGIIVHGIKGSSRSICAETVADMAEALEHAAKSGDLAFVETRNTAFSEAVAKLISDIEAALAQTRADKLKTIKENPDRGTLERLRCACIAHEMDSIDSIIAELDGYEYETGGDLIAWLRDKAEMMSYSEIAGKLSADVG